MRHHNEILLILLIILLIPAVLALHKGVRTVVVPTTPECLAGRAETLHKHSEEVYLKVIV